jgi:hypothetical protein
MNLSHEILARAQVSARLREAEQARPGRQLSRVLRTGRRAEEIAQQARLALARSL